MKKFILVILFIGTFYPVFGTDIDILLNVALIPDSLKKDALAVIREDNEIFEYQSLEKGVYTEKVTITILKEHGKDYANFMYPGDKYRTLGDFSGKIYDATGNLVGKIKKSEVQSSEWSEYLGSDDINYSYICHLPSYPCTVVYEYSINFKNGILSFPRFYPQYDSDISVQKATYQLIVPQNTKVLFKELNIAPAEKSVIKNQDSYIWKVNNLKAFEDEPMMPNYRDFVPLVYARPQEFMYDGVKGEITDWKSLGAWKNSLLKNRQTLSDDTKAKIKSMTDAAPTEKEKVKILYDYLGKTTHYENISLGIGGYQPMLSSEVCKIGFGDCKGLSNYLRAMLMSIGIHSDYVNIQASEKSKNIFEDYANFNQFNHIILRVPLPNDTLWLECTNPEEPFGFVHNSIAGHQALVVSDSGGEIVRLPDYPDSLNVDKNRANITLSADGKAQANVVNIFNVKEYDDYAPFTKLESAKQVDMARRMIHLPTANVSNVSYKEDKSALPSLSIIFNWDTPLLGNKTGTRLFVPANPMRQFDVKLKKKDRKFDIWISNGSVNEDSITLNIPDNYEVESLPAPTDFQDTFGSFKSSISVSGNEIIIYQVFRINHGLWKVDKYSELLELFDKVSAAYKGKIILRSK